MRNIDEWLNSLPKDTKEMIPLEEKPHINLINYLWVNNILSNKEALTIPSVDELLSWISGGKIESKRG